ncbi:TetR/AcrR family transcriptional regulator [Dyella terrae]|uniref:TetR/AcrR family transcriptional regulator n=1 Tax=Dyella terrae TaxID=522259 RepID=UPI001EFE3AA6|nr:CerR family C-terminal domain-containing protein [Dyella terrae]ULU26076.1 Tetracyclin repressor protein [Dyella terrae]
MSKPRRAIRTDGEATRQRILEAAGELFAAEGYAEATSKAIAARAEVDLASINYHFGNRNGLYQAVLAEAHRQLISLVDLRALAGSDLPASDKLRKVFERLVERSKEESGWNIRVLARELLAPSSHLKVLLQTEVLPKIAVVKQILSDISGIPPEDPALIRCLISIAAPCGMLLVAGRGAPGPLGDVLQMPGPALVNHLHTFAMAGLEAISRDYGKSTDLPSPKPKAARVKR